MDIQLDIQLGVLWRIGTHPHTDKIGYENRDFEAIRPPLMSETTPLKQRLKFIKVADNERLMRSRAENTEKKRLKPLFRGAGGVSVEGTEKHGKESKCDSWGNGGGCLRMDLCNDILVFFLFQSFDFAASLCKLFTQLPQFFRLLSNGEVFLTENIE